MSLSFKETITYDDYGTVIAVGIKHDNKDNVIHRFYAFWNHGATQAKELNWIQDDYPPYFAFFWSTRRNLLKSLKGIALMGLLQKNEEAFDEKRLGAAIEAAEIAEEIFFAIPKESFTRSLGVVPGHRYNVVIPETEESY